MMAKFARKTFDMVAAKQLAALAALLLLLFSSPALAERKTGGSFEISNDAVSAAGSPVMQAGQFKLLYSLGQAAGYIDFFQVLNNFTTGYMIESGYVSGIEAVFSAFNLATTVAAPVGGGYLGGATDAVPGARITYSLSFSNTGEAAIDPVSGTSTIPVTGTLPAGVAFEPGTITLGGVAKTDVADADECSYVAGPKTVVCNVPMTAGATGTLQYKGIIQ